MIVLETERTILRELTCNDAEFILRVLNDPGFVRYIGDRGVRSEDAARKYIEDGPMRSYAANGFGLWCVELKEGEVPLGICGLLKRETLPDVDIGFAFLPDYCGRGYAFEASRAVLDAVRDKFGIDRVLAITSPDNVRSMTLLEKLGLRFQGMTPSTTVGEPDLKLFAVDV